MMSSLGDALKEIVTNIKKDPETEAQLQGFRKEIAESYVQKLEKEKSDLFLSIGRDLIVDYLVDEGFTDSIHDAFVEKVLISLSSNFSDLKEFRDKLKNATTDDVLSSLKIEIEKEVDKDPQESSLAPENKEFGASVSSLTSPESSKNTGIAIDISQWAENFYDQLEGKEKLDIQAFSLAFYGYEKLKSELKNPKYLTVVDFSKSNKQERMFIINMKTKTIENSLSVGHGKNSGDEFAKNFSDTLGSRQSSLGFYRTPSEITKSHTKSWYGLRMNGIEDSNDNANNRGIYMHPGGLKSEGCFTLQMSQQEADKIMNKLKGDSLLFAYYPNDKYLASSKIIGEKYKKINQSIA